MRLQKGEPASLGSVSSNRSHITRTCLASLTLGILLSAFYLWGIPKVPFHPDEATYLWMSADFELLQSNPLAISWNAGTPTDLAQHYRLIDAPLTRYLLGLARVVSAQNGLQSDWDWTMTWKENQAAGALPDDRLIHSGRYLLALLFPLDLILISSIGRRLHSQAAGTLAMVFFGLNALVLLHTRRAMAEAILTFGVLAAAWSFLDAGRRPWLAGLTLGFAVCAKHTAIALFPAGMFAAALPAVHSELLARKTDFDFEPSEIGCR